MEIKECTQDVWDAFVDASPQGTVFNKSVFLNSYRAPVTYLLCFKGEEPMAGFAFVPSQEGIKIMPFSTYAGIIFRDMKGQDTYSRNEIVFSVLEAFSTYLFEKYAEVDFLNHWDVLDMRAFHWLNYHERQKGHYQITPCYTSFLDISNPENTDGYARKRVRELGKGAKEGQHFSTKVIDDVELLNRLHGQNFARQGITRSMDDILALRGICRSLLATKQGVLLATFVNDKPAVASFFIYDKFRAYHLFVGTELEYPPRPYQPRPPPRGS